MFRYLIVVVALVATLLADAVSWEKDFKSGVENAKKIGKPIFFVSSRHSCKYCVILEEQTLSHPDVIKKLNEEFVSIISYSDENDYMPREFWRPGTPALWFMYPDSTPMFQPLMGAVDAQNFLKALNIVKAEFGKSSLSAKSKEK